MFYDAPQPSCAFYVLTEEAYCVLRGFTRHLGDLPRLYLVIQIKKTYLMCVVYAVNIVLIYQRRKKI